MTCRRRKTLCILNSENQCKLYSSAFILDVTVSSANFIKYFILELTESVCTVVALGYLILIDISNKFFEINVNALLTDYTEN